MNKWYHGSIAGVPVSIFLSDNWEMDYLIEPLEEGKEPPPKTFQKVLKACEAIRASRMRSLQGCQKILAENGWSNS